MTAQTIFYALRYCAAQLGMNRFRPHDLRRTTYAILPHQGKAPLEQIPLSLGHDSIQTTE